ncbi:hypothetical protein G3N95_17800 [Paraburkholderia sp. Tr-20389]|uniref:hypothetical protein n=1 Tax=Paraburkholderia sp. Tr-20389 TaxID=2703903 RepID=UPI00197DE1E2|nr:hypothetical protein [Paraburkholderia sp. Tr-20389]MBN3754808.1 hypothetical protein [Paraburkholderia sp. Tr-20389]
MCAASGSNGRLPALGDEATYLSMVKLRLMAQSIDAYNRPIVAEHETLKAVIPMAIHFGTCWMRDEANRPELTFMNCGL